MTPSRPASTFYALGVRPKLVEALASRGIVEPFPIQAASLPDALAGRDVLGRGRTGSGKTVAFALPLLERVLTSEFPRQSGRPRALVLVPTRELAVQVAETVDYLARAVRCKTMTVFGGVRYTGQVRKLERGVDVVVATPGRLEDLIEQGHLSLDAVEVVVLDEADLMADMGFLPPVTRILEAIPPGQRMLFSATLDGDVAELVTKFLHDPATHSLEGDESAPDAQHYLFGVRHDNKPAVLRELLGGGGRTLAFTRTKSAAERLARTLTEAGIPAVDLHGNLRQAARQRNLAAFADGSVSVLVATDIAARGIHVDDVGLVVHVDPPNDPKAFLHRSGRTARAGSEGNVVTLVTRNQNKTVRALMAQAKIKPKQVVVSPGDEILTEVRAPRIEPAASGTSIFEPDAEDIIEEPSRDERPRAERSREERAWGRPPRGDRPRDGRPHRERPRREGPRDEQRAGESGERPASGGIEYRPRREPKQHVSGARGPRPDWSDTTPRPDRRRPENTEWTSEWWGAEPWEVDERADRRPGRSQRRPGAAGAKQGRPGREERGGRSGREDSRPRPGRDARREQRDERRPDAAGAAAERTDRPGRAKARWTAEDRRKAAESDARGFGYRKEAPKGAKSGGPSKHGHSAKAGKTVKGGKPGKPGKGKPVRDKDKGKRRKPS